MESAPAVSPSMTLTLPFLAQILLTMMSPTSTRYKSVPCRHCGKTLLQRGHRAGKATYHDQCRAESRSEIQRRLDQDRWGRTPGAERDRILSRAHEADDG